MRIAPVSIITFTLCLSLVACASPEDKVRQKEQGNEALRESSGYNECMRKVKADEQKLADCYVAKMAADGYTDGLECVGTGNTDPRCNNTARYNSEVNAHNTCPQEVQYETELTEGDCMQMLMDAQR